MSMLQQDKLHEFVSELMDGEMTEQEGSARVGAFLSDRSACEKWHTYHLIREVMQDPDCVGCDISNAVQAAVASEPTIVAPKRLKPKQGIWSKPLIGLALAASVAGLMLASTPMLGLFDTSSSEQHLVQTNSIPRNAQGLTLEAYAQRPLSAEEAPRLNHYLFDHAQYTPLYGRANTEFVGYGNRQ